MKHSYRYLLVLALAFAGCETMMTSSEPVAAEDGRVWVSHAFPTGRESNSAVLLERGTPPQVPIGQPYDYELRVRNLTEHPLEDVVITEHIAVSVDKAEPEAASVGDGKARWELGTLAAKETRVIKVTATPTSTGDLQSRCEIEYRSLLYGSTTVYEPKLALEREAVDASLVGEPVAYKLTVSNPGSGPARGVVVEGSLPDGVPTIEGAKGFRFEVGDLAAGEKKEYVVQVRGSVTGDYILAAAAVGKGDLQAAAAPAPLLVRKAMLEVETSGPAEWVLDRPARYVVTVRNSGDGATRDGSLRLLLPEGAAFVRASEQPTGVAQEVRWDLGTLAAGAERNIEVFVKPARAGDMAGKLTLSASFCSAATAEWRTKVVGVAALAVEVSDALDPIGAGAEETYRVVVRNQGSAAGVNIVVVCVLEDTMKFVSADGATKGVAEAGKVVFEPLAELAPGASAEWTVVVNAAGSGDVRFKAVVTSADMQRPVEAAESTRFYGVK